MLYSDAPNPALADRTPRPPHPPTAPTPDQADAEASALVATLHDQKTELENRMTTLDRQRAQFEAHRAEVVRLCLRLSPNARIPQVVIERMGSSNGDVP